MPPELPFTQLVQHICTRPNMYVLNGTYAEVSAYINGYANGNPSCPIGGHQFAPYNRFVCVKHGFPTNYVGAAVIAMCTPNDAEAIERLRTTLLEFVELSTKMTEDELLKYAATRYKVPEGEPEKVFRTFSAALLAGDLQTIQALAKPHENLHILWAGVYPEGVAGKLQQLADSQPVRCIYQSADKKTARVISAHFPFPFDMHCHSGQWLIDASPLIKLRARRQ